LCVQHEEHAAAGSRIWYVVVAPTLRQAAESLSAIRSGLDLLAPLGIRYELREENTSPQITIIAPTSRCEKIIGVMTADSCSVRGFAIAHFCIDEASFFPVDGASSLKSILRALEPGTLQFPSSSSVLASSPGAPAGIFYDLAQKPPKDTVVVQGSTWEFNPRVTKEQCLSLASGDERVFRVEYAASEWGFVNESFIDVSGVVFGDRFAELGPRPGHFILGMDIGQTQDSSAFAVISACDIEIPGSSPIRHYVIEDLDLIPPSKTAPFSIEMIVSRACAIASRWGNAPIICDPWSGVEVQRALAQRGWSLYDGSYWPSPRQYMIAKMSAPAQTPRWSTLRSVVAGGRLHFPDTQTARELARQLAGLTATTLSSGSLKVEGRRDDLADALAIGIEIAMKMPPTPAVGGSTIEMIDSGFHRSMDGRFHYDLPKYIRRYPNGDIRQIELPTWDPNFEAYAREMIANGMRTPAIEAWEKERSGDTGPPVAWPINTTVRH
jgi:hypothetical protein